MVARKFEVLHHDSNFDVEYDPDDGFEVFKIQLFSLTSIPPDEQKIYGCEDDRPVASDSDLITISEKLRLVSIDEDEQQAESSTQNAELMRSDEELARLLQAEEEELMLRQYLASQDNGQFGNRIRPYLNQIQMYEDSSSQEAARKTVPVEELEEKALVSLAKEGNFNPSKSEKDHAFLLQLLFWFKQSFRWVNSPPCHDCGNKTVGQGMTDALPSETLYGASRVELYRCTICSKFTRFPRYNDPIKLVQTREGRCGEWANCFTLYCRAFGYDSRLVVDFTDHVWTECFSQFLGRWMHLDPCEGVYDKPLLYEKGWNKKLNYCIAVAKDGVYDVTKRYTRKWHEVLSQRTIITEPALSSVLANITKECRRGFPSQLLSIIEARDVEEKQLLERCLHSQDDVSLSLPGRRSGDEEWCRSRMEIGSNKNSTLSSSSCPVRLCVDEHVTRIYNAFRPILHQFVNEALTISEAAEVLKIMRGIVLNLQHSPFKTRRTSSDSTLKNPIFQESFPSFDELLDALSLEKKVDTDGSVEIWLAGDPVRTSLALPVVLDALDDLLSSLEKCEKFTAESLALPMLKLNRIHSGSVVASAEELPSGIVNLHTASLLYVSCYFYLRAFIIITIVFQVTSAFDGTRLSKWEEPNGARGCWIEYRTFGNKKYELAAYELMSANDAPERDPMDWILEGSEDDGISWRVLDKQTSQDSRKVWISRFRFLASRDIQSTSRLQVGSIDLYARTA
ncbi:peptide-N(4)-(N-acetyl-beta-glucosaminyl)asparagine amidase isoform X3 [Prosopis cineraria]|uniref:peptide-N(4)-(N-acetyl-beta- glucosaminyl)asparagine amidase isoform X3 n=1 Tax=Prosopis cineraria TaxID=364024 RepID=UPI00240F78EB|nr:peptide-N(4)-(N-acetyl-beta-glucosaminyl)asparagine amidase isoform X3 [Prosopis cineraria]